MRLWGHFARLGGVLVRPARTFERIVDGEGRVSELLPWVVAVDIAIAPQDLGRGILLGRRALLEGVIAFINAIANRMSIAFIGALVGAVIVFAGEHFGRPRESRRGFDAALDGAAFTLVPYLALAALGALLAHAGLDLAWMPHRSLRGGFGEVAFGAAVAYGPSLILMGVLAKVFWTPPRPPTA